MRTFTDEELEELAAFDKEVDDSDFDEEDFDAGKNLERDVKTERNQKPRYRREYYLEHREQIIEKAKQYNRDNAEAIKRRKHEYYVSHKAEYLRRNRENYAKRKHGGQAGH